MHTKILSVILLVVACNNIFAMENPTQNTNDQETTPNVVGGYNQADVTDPQVKKAADFAVSKMQQGTLVQIDSAEIQLVAGTNYKLQLILEQNGQKYKYMVVVFQPIPNTNQPMQLTNVQAMGMVQSSQ